MYTYFLNESNQIIPRQSWGDSLEELYPNLSKVVEMNPDDNGWNAVMLKKQGAAGWLPVEYRSVENNDLDEILASFEM